MAWTCPVLGVGSSWGTLKRMWGGQVVEGVVPGDTLDAACTEHVAVPAGTPDLLAAAAAAELTGLAPASPPSHLLSPVFHQPLGAHPTTATAHLALLHFLAQQPAACVGPIQIHPHSNCFSFPPLTPRVRPAFPSRLYVHNQPLCLPDCPPTAASAH
eukprot:scaffold137430_cov17-Tisochrysis_lutea.AAC.2